jgi:hypothetical protein
VEQFGRDQHQRHRAALHRGLQIRDRPLLQQD